MRNKAIACATAAALFAGWVGAAQAGTVTLNPDNANIQVGQTVTFTYTMDFTDDPTVGGGTDFFYDSSILQFVGWSFDTDFTTTDDPTFRRDPTDCASANSDAGCGFDANEFLANGADAQVNGMAWGDFGGMSGPDIVGTMVFQAVGTGLATIYMTANDDSVAANPGPFFSAGPGNPQQTVNFVNGQVTVSQVPLPAAAWLMLGGLGAIGGFRRKA